MFATQRVSYYWPCRNAVGSKLQINSNASIQSRPEPTGETFLRCECTFIEKKSGFHLPLNKPVFESGRQARFSKTRRFLFYREYFESTLMMKKNLIFVFVFWLQTVASMPQGSIDGVSCRTFGASHE